MEWALKSFAGVVMCKNLQKPAKLLKPCKTKDLSGNTWEEAGISGTVKGRGQIAKWRIRGAEFLNRRQRNERRS